MAKSTLQPFLEFKDQKEWVFVKERTSQLIQRYASVFRNGGVSILSEEFYCSKTRCHMLKRL